MTKRERTKVLGPGDEMPWEGIRPPSPRIRDQARYIRAELGHALCKRFSGADCVVVPCPVEDELDPHTVTICGSGECDNVRISCSEGHGSGEVILAIIGELTESG